MLSHSCNHLQSLRAALCMSEEKASTNQSIRDACRIGLMEHLRCAFRFYLRSGQLSQRLQPLSRFMLTTLGLSQFTSFGGRADFTVLLTTITQGKVAYNEPKRVQFVQLQPLGVGLRLGSMVRTGRNGVMHAASQYHVRGVVARLPVLSRHGPASLCAAGVAANAT